MGLRETAYYRYLLSFDERSRRVNPEAEPDTEIRNPPLEHYLPMAAACAERGLFVLRMGQVVDRPLPAGGHPRVIDYAWIHRSPFGDIYLLATCKFVVAGGSALWWIGAAWNRPAVYTDNYCLAFRGVRPGSLLIPKLMWLVAEKRFLSFEEMLRYGMRYSYASNCRQDGVELIHNSPEEVTEVVLEMDQRLDGTWRQTPEDVELHRRFEGLFRPEHMGYRMPGRIGTQFLRRYSYLLESPRAMRTVVTDVHAQ
jgi:putative glycosyltransferase (TIGR04372 family)